MKKQKSGDQALPDDTYSNGSVTSDLLHSKLKNTIVSNSDHNDSLLSPIEMGGLKSQSESQEQKLYMFSYEASAVHGMHLIRTLKKLSQALNKKDRHLLPQLVGKIRKDKFSNKTDLEALNNIK